MHTQLLTTGPDVLTRLLPGAAIAVLALSAIAAVPEGATLEPRTEHVNFNIGCNQAADGATCDSTQYWLGKGTGSSNVAGTYDVTPLNYVLRAAGEGTDPTTFNGDQTLADSYVLQGGAELAGQVKVTGYVGDTTDVAVDSTVEVTVRARTVDDNKPVTLGSAAVNKQVVTPGDTVYEFSFTVPEELEAVEVRLLSATLKVTSATVMGNGFVNGQGESWFDLPYYEVIEEEVTEDETTNESDTETGGDEGGTGS